MKVCFSWILLLTYRCFCSESPPVLHLNNMPHKISTVVHIIPLGALLPPSGPEQTVTQPHSQTRWKNRPHEKLTNILLISSIESFCSSELSDLFICCAISCYHVMLLSNKCAQYSGKTINDLKKLVGSLKEFLRLRVLSSLDWKAAFFSQ